MLRKQYSQTQVRIAFALIAAIAVFAAAHLLAVTVFDGRWQELAYMFNLDSEWNAPTLYSGMILAGCAFMSLVLSSQTKVRAESWRWLGIGAIFLYVAFDELLIIHERYAAPLRNLFSIPDGSWFYHAWVLLAIVVAVALLIFVRLIRSHSAMSSFQKRIIVLIAIAAAGAVILEIIGTQVYVSPVAYQLGPVFVEEIFEIGIISYILFKLSSVAFKTGTGKLKA